MASIEFDEVEILDTDHIPRFIKHESAPERELTLLNLAREGGSILVAEKYGMKRIFLRGYLTATTQALLEAAIDDFKELFSRKEKELDISWEVGTRRYIATCVRHDFDRDHFHLLFVPWTAEFVVVSGIGEAISETRQVEDESFSAAYKEDLVTFAGSAKPKPRIRIKSVYAATVPKGISIENTDTGEKIIITRLAGMGAGKYFEMDCRLKTAKYNNVVVPFHGVFPTFEVGDNNYKIQPGEVLDQEFYYPDPYASRHIYGDLWVAQSFTVPDTDDTYQVIKLYLSKEGTPGPQNPLTITIQTDIDGKPDGNVVPNATFSIDKSDVYGTKDWVRAQSASAFKLKANTRYWIVVKTIDGDINNKYNWWMANTALRSIYRRGNASQSTDAGNIWNDQPIEDMIFRLYYAGISYDAGTYNFDIYYYERFL